MQITNRSDGSSRITTRRRLNAESDHKKRRKSLAALSSVGLLFAGTAAAYYALEGTGNGNTAGPSGAPATVPITVTGQPATETGGGSLLLFPEATSGVSGVSETVSWQLSDTTSSRS